MAVEVQDLVILLLQEEHGGSGIVVLRAPGPLGPTFSVTPGGTKSTLPAPAGGCTVISFTANWNVDYKLKLNYKYKL